MGSTAASDSGVSTPSGPSHPCIKDDGQAQGLEHLEEFSEWQRSPAASSTPTPSPTGASTPRAYGGVYTASRGLITPPEMPLLAPEPPAQPVSREGRGREGKTKLPPG
eukprot:Hpha_TRINITY_DN15478_c3_g13::TRINITY_DN15478_c3_g13_i1::g.174267::m.174267